jgi:hypothetical protein
METENNPIDIRKRAAVLRGHALAFRKSASFADSHQARQADLQNAEWHLQEAERLEKEANELERTSPRRNRDAGLPDGEPS